MTPTGLEPEPPESIAAAVAALTRALTGAVTEADSAALDAVMQQILARLDAQHGRTGRVTYDLTDDHPGQSSGRPDGRGGAVRTVRMELPGNLGASMASLSDQTGKDMAFLMGTGATLLCLVVEHLWAGRSVYAEDPDSGQRRQLTVDWA